MNKSWREIYWVQQLFQQMLGIELNTKPISGALIAEEMAASNPEAKQKLYRFYELVDMLDPIISQEIDNALEEAAKALERMSGTTHTPVGGYSNISWVEKDRAAQAIRQLKDTVEK